LAAAGTSAKATRPDPHGQDQKLSLYAEPVAFMKFCDIKVNGGALSQALSSVGLKSSAMPGLQAEADKLVTLLQAQNNTVDAKVAFCRRAKTIPFVEKVSTKE
jgi:hypothetical protein